MSNEWTPPSGSGASGNVPNYMVPAIISLFCCLPFGIAGVVFAAQVNSKVAAGDIQGAMESSKKAKMFSFIAIGLGAAAIICYVIFFVVVGGIGIMNS